MDTVAPHVNITIISNIFFVR